MVEGAEPKGAPRALWTPRALAAMLGVPPNTLRTWRHRYDLGPTARTAGGHRRYTDEDVERVRRMLVLTASGIAPAAAAAMAAANTPAHEAAVRHVGVSSRRVNVGLRRAANRLDAHLVQDIATTLIAERGVVAAWEHVLLPLLVDLGERFEAGGKGIEVEHVASTAIQQALRDVPFPGRPGRLVALLACAPEEQHSLPLDALGAALSERGQTWLNLGARVPADVLRESIGKLAPAVVVVWAHRADLAERVPVVELADRPDLVVALAGGGWLGVESPDSVLRPATLREALGLVLAAVRVEAH